MYLLIFDKIINGVKQALQVIFQPIGMVSLQKLSRSHDLCRQALHDPTSSVSMITLARFHIPISIVTIISYSMNVITGRRLSPDSIPVRSIQHTFIP